MGQIMYHHQTFGVHPLLILDDVLSELDPRKGARLLEFLEGVRSQILLTTTDLAQPFQFGNESSGLFKVSQGRVERLK
jgi:recombinational DNA repair ATPase RecF